MQFRLKVKIEGEVVVSANNAEAAELLVQFCDPNLSGTKVIRSTVTTEVLGILTDVELQPADVVILQNTGETSH